MPADIEPPALARLVDFAERPRTRDWSLRAALVRYAQPEPQRVNDLLELVRRVEWALGQDARALAHDGEELWSALDAGDASGPHARLVGVLRAARDLDGLGDLLAAWALDPARDRPDGEVDRVIAGVAERLDALGVPREERARPPGRRG